MTNYRRAYQPGGCYFFTVVTERRRPLLIDNIEHLRRAFRMAKDRRAFQIDAVVILPEHLHTIWRLPDGDVDFSTRWMHLKRCFSAALPEQEVGDSKRNRREKGVWQRRFWEHAIRDEEDWKRHMDYVHFNPVKHGYCEGASDWPHSSFRRCVEDGLYASDWGREMPVALRGLDLE